ncbi:hypothetical protein [Pseudomonas putida]|uniref:hypothetical protein n=1 Tax=Pseudomonas putida TaxID=303 RepID=UPI00111009A0|nr:hypothetical protein [Pseudomonas putida]
MRLKLKLPQLQITKKPTIEICAIIISLLALFTTTHQSYLTRIHNFKSVEPRINAYRTLDENYRIVIFNNGLGPAFIEDITYFVKGKKIKSTTIVPALTQLGIDSMCYKFGAPRRGDSFKTQEEIDLVKFRNDEKCAIAKTIFSFLSPEDLDLEIEFKSIYDEQFVYRYSLNKQTPI